MRNLLLNLSEANFATECIVGQADGSPVTQIHPTFGSIFQKSIAIDALNFVGMKSDGKFYLASAEAGAGQIKCLGLNFQEAANGSPIDVIDEPRTIRLAAAVSGAVAGHPAYLSVSTPGTVQKDVPSVTGQLIQIVGTFIDTQTVKTNVQVVTSVVA